jgi:hypothetical protein
VRLATIRLALLAALVAAGPARAQDAAPAGADPRAARFSDVERGLFIGLEAGWPVVLTKTPTKDPVKFPYAPNGGGTATGLGIGLELGYDLTNHLALSLFADGFFEKAGTDYGAFDLMVAGVDARYAFYGVKDRNGWERFQVYVHARGGYVLTHPTGLFGTTDTLVGGGLGVEYFAQLRHFSWWAQVDGMYVLSAGAPGGGLLTGVRYTF